MSEYEFTAFEKQAYDEVIAFEKERETVFNREFDYVKQNIDYDPELMELDDLDSVEYIGYVELEKTNYKQSGYSNFDFYLEKGGSKFEYYMRQDGENGYHNLVHQWSVGMSGDSWSGYLLFPLKDGRYWKIGYSC